MSYESIGKIAHEIGTSRQNLSKMLKRHREEAPQPNSKGKYNLEEVRAFYHHRTYKSTVCEDLKERILEQQYRLKKIKADEAEKRVIPKALVIDLWRDTDVVLENALKRAAQIAAKKRIVNPNYNEEALCEEILEDIKPRFNRWRDFLKTLT